MIGKEDIAKLAKLARIAINAEEKESFVKEIDSILAYVDQIQEISNTTIKNNSEEVTNVFREDENPHESALFSKEIILAAPEKEDGLVKVKKII
jgi:aspartyl-tRNA(Asn)/glutamyl-tRNA(Gln) amidotransferase subunit C